MYLISYNRILLLRFGLRTEKQANKSVVFNKGARAEENFYTLVYVYFYLHCGFKCLAEDGCCLQQWLLQQIIQ